MLLFERRSWQPHLPWFLFFLAGTALASGGYFGFTYATGSPHWPGGASIPGLLCGILGGLIIVFEFLLWFRKKERVRAWRIGRTQTWMRAHIWLGLLSVPVLTYHSGFRLGGTLATMLMALFFVVIGSGIWGLILQQILPKRMLTEIPAETIYSQIDQLAARLISQAREIVRATCGPVRGEAEMADVPSAPRLAIDAVRSVGRVQGKVPESRAPTAPVPDTDALRGFFSTTVEPFLRGIAPPDSPLHVHDRAVRVFEELRTRLPTAAHRAVDSLEDFCTRRRQWDKQSRLHFWLHNWLWAHFPLSVALVVLMAVHACVAWKYR